MATIAAKRIKKKSEVIKKKCPICGKQKNIATGFYKSSSPMYEDGCVPICILCVKNEVINEDGTVNENRLKTMCQRIDKPFFTDELDAAFSQARSEHGYLSNDEIARMGDKIVGFYFKNINSLRQNKNRSYADSEQMGFTHNKKNYTQEKKKEAIAFRYNDVIDDNKKTENTSYVPQIQEDISWTAQDIQNKDYAIEIIGYDPFVGYPEWDRRFLFNQLAPYLEDDDIADDAYKLSQILQIVDNNKQIRQCDVKISNLDPIKDADNIKLLNGIKKDLVMSNDKIAKENEISVKNRSNKDVGKSTLTYLMRDLRTRDFDRAEADYYDQLKSAGTRWAVDMSMTSIIQHGMFDENDKKDIYETQLRLIDKLNQELDDAKEKIRLLLLEIDKLKAGVGDGN